MACGVYHYASIHVPLYLWVFLGSILICLIVYVWYWYAKAYPKFITSLRQGLDELKSED
jgi:hypothetical protein